MISVSEKNRYSIYWAHKFSAPYVVDSFSNELVRLDSSYSYMATDLRPVFLEEKFILAQVCPECFTDCFEKSVWADSSNNFFVDGKKIKASLIRKIQSTDLKAITTYQDIPPHLMVSEKSIFRRFIELNRNRYNYLLHCEDADSEGWPIGAEPFLWKAIEKYPQRTPFVSFSGGKDSTAVSALVSRAFNKPSIIHIFGDTTLEFPETYAYIERFRERHELTPFLLEKNDSSDFMQLCQRIGPPSRVKSWCCSIFKTGPMGTTLADMDLQLLTFYGIRRFESVSRSKYDRVTQSPKLKKQIVASPIIDWLDIDVWLYIFTSELDFNKAYRYGFTRVGCWCCPNNSTWSDLLMAIWHPGAHRKWQDFLLQFAKDIGKPDPEVYVRDGKWKARQGGHGLENSATKINSKACTAESNAIQYTLTRALDSSFYEFFKPFGTLEFSMGKRSLSEVFVIGDDKQILLKIAGLKGSTQVKVSILGDFNAAFHSKNLNRNIAGYINRQIRKYQTCINCMACNSICPVSAIDVSANSYTINEKKCTHCLKCVMHFSSGCLVASALATRKDSI